MLKEPSCPSPVPAVPLHRQPLVLDLQVQPVVSAAASKLLQPPKRSQPLSHSVPLLP